MCINCMYNNYYNYYDFTCVCIYICIRLGCSLQGRNNLPIAPDLILTNSLPPANVTDKHLSGGVVGPAEFGSLLCCSGLQLSSGSIPLQN